MPTTPFDLVAELIARFNSKDAASFAELFAEGADFTDVIGQTAQGKPHIARQHEFPFKNNLRLAVLAATTVTIRPLGEGASVALVKWTLTGCLSVDGSAAPDCRGTMQVVMHHQDGALRIVSVLNQDPMGTFGRQMAERRHAAAGPK